MEITFEVNERELAAIQDISEDFSLSVEDYCRRATIPPIEDKAMARLAQHITKVGKLFDEYCLLLTEIKRDAENIGPGYHL